VAGLSQQRLAELAGCSISTVRFYEAGHGATTEMLAKLAEPLGCKPEELRNSETPAGDPGPRENREGNSRRGEA
jgi:transcriptional regulator with XRE-family HTH domain